MTSQKKLCERAILNWPEEDRPREELLKHGAHTLSNAELLAILIRTGVKGSSAVDLRRELLRRFKTLRQMNGADVAELHGIKGLSTAKIAHIKAAVLSTELRKKDLWPVPWIRLTNQSHRRRKACHEFRLKCAFDMQRIQIMPKETFQ
jgi:hypothetical protein